MSLSDRIRGWFSSSNWQEVFSMHPANFKAEEALITYLIGLVGEETLIPQRLEERRRIQHLSDRRAKGLGYAQLYLLLEKFIISNKPPATKAEYKDKQSLRADVAQHVTITDLSPAVRIIFSSEQAQAVLLLTIALPVIMQQLRESLGDVELHSTFAAAIKGTIFAKSTIIDKTIAVENILPQVDQIPFADVLLACQAIYQGFIDRLTHTFGLQTINPLIEQMYEVVADTYDHDILGLFLDTIPPAYLESKKLVFLSRQDLAEKVMDATAALMKEKESVEQKVRERTEELNQKVKELHESNELLSKREEELLLANNRLRELDKAKTEFISVAAHQLRTPLSAIKWTLSMLLEAPPTALTAEQRDLVHKGYDSNERMVTLVNEMLVVTRIEAGNMPYVFEPVQLEDLVTNVLSDFVVQAGKRHVTVKFVKPEEPLAPVEGDTEKLRAVVQNLTDNAFSYTPDGGTVTVTIAPEGESMRVSVVDSGIGIPSSQQTDVFTKFFRANNAIKMKTDGSGLGLFIAKSMVDQHNGTIGFASEGEGKGTTFFFTIPRSHAPPAA